MEGGVEIDQARRFLLNNYNNGTGFFFPSSSPPPSSLTAQQEDRLLLLLHNRAGDVACGRGGSGFLGPRPLTPSFNPSRSLIPPPTHSSHTSSLIQTQPPLLPLPFSRSKSLPPPPTPSHNPRKSNANNPRKPNSIKPSSSKQKKEAAAKPGTEAEAPPTVARAPVAKMKEEEEVEDQEEEKVFSMSPPPSSLPLPKFALKPRVTTSAPSCNAEALGSVGARGAKSGAGAGTASDDLRRLLRL